MIAINYVIPPLYQCTHSDLCAPRGPLAYSLNVVYYATVAVSSAPEACQEYDLYGIPPAPDLLRFNGRRCNTVHVYNAKHYQLPTGLISAMIDLLQYIFKAISAAVYLYFRSYYVSGKLPREIIMHP